MRINEIIHEDITRRGFVGGAAAAALGATSQSRAGQYVHPSEVSTADQFMFYEKQKPKLQFRANQILGKLQVTIARNDPNTYNKKTKDIELEVGWVNQVAAADIKLKLIYLDVTVYYDLSDDAIAFTLGHELGHFVNGTSSYHLDPKGAELKADIYGVRLASLAGYNVNEALRDIHEAGKFFSQGSKTHPSHDERLKNVRSAGYPAAGSSYLDPAKHQAAKNQLASTTHAISSVKNYSK
jgi:hypothetical protein